jgi:hypothetical protein
MMRCKKTFLAIFFIAFLFAARAQDFGYNVIYEGIFDNREYFSGYNEHETIFGSRISGSAGALFDSTHTLKAGLSGFYEFGGKLGDLPPELLLYYSFSNTAFELKMGAFPRSGVINFPNALFSEKYGYYNYTVEGLWLKYKYRAGSFDAFVDWVARRDSSRREQIMFGLSGKQHAGNFLFGEYAYMFHNAKTLSNFPGEHIEDNLGACFLAGYNFSGLVPLSSLTVKTGALASAYRNRGETRGFDIRASWYSELIADYRGYGIEAFFKFGDKHRFSQGDLFYNNAENYIRANVYFTPINFDKVKGRVSWSFHISNGVLDNQQKFSLVYILD